MLNVGKMSLEAQKAVLFLVLLPLILAGGPHPTVREQSAMAAAFKERKVVC